jgi:predicted DNA binding CopG/RHH family protein
VQDSGEQGGTCMKKSGRYTDAPKEINDALLSATEIEDFLPPPDQLIAKEETQKITIALSQRSVEFFKSAADENHIPYQQLIRKVLDNYTEHYAK